MVYPRAVVLGINEQCRGDRLVLETKRRSTPRSHGKYPPYNTVGVDTPGCDSLFVLRVGNAAVSGAGKVIRTHELKENTVDVRNYA